MVLITAQILSAMQREEGADKKAFKYILWIVVPTAALIGIENLSTAALLLAVIFLMMFIGRVPMSQMVKLVGAAGLVIVLFLTLVLTLGSIGADDEKSTQTVEAVTANTTDTKVIKGGGVFHRFVTWRNRIVKHLDKRMYHLWSTTSTKMPRWHTPILPLFRATSSARDLDSLWSAISCRKPSLTLSLPLLSRNLASLVPLS